MTTTALAAIRLRHDPPDPLEAAFGLEAIERYSTLRIENCPSPSGRSRPEAGTSACTITADTQNGQNLLLIRDRRIAALKEAQATEATAQAKKTSLVGR
jgi:hypothetical protein